MLRCPQRFTGATTGFWGPGNGIVASGCVAVRAIRSFSIASPQDGSAAYSSEHLIPTLCRNLRSSGVFIVRLAIRRSATSVKQSRHQCEKGFTRLTFLRQRGQRHWTTSSCADEKPTPDMCLGTPPHLQANCNLRYFIFRHPVFRPVAS
jgi:hypothetical protein